MEFKWIETSKLKSCKYNPRSHTEEQISKLVNSFSNFGFTNPILVTKGLQIIAGHARFSAALKANIDKVPIIILSLDKKQSDAYMIADNQLAISGADWDFPKLADLLSELDTGDFDIGVIGFDDKELEKIATWTLNEEKTNEKKTKNKCPKCGYEW